MDLLRTIFSPFFGLGGDRNEEPDRAESDEEEDEEEDEDADEHQPLHRMREHKKIDYQRMDRGDELHTKRVQSGTTTARSPTPKKRQPIESSSTPASSHKKVKREPSSPISFTKKTKTPSKSAGLKGKWIINWEKGDATTFHAQDRVGAWFEVKPVDVIGKDDPRLELVTPELLQEKRGLLAKSLVPTALVAVEGDWVRVHFQGWNAKYDEWLLFDRGGFICTKDTGACFCVRHKKGIKTSVKPSSEKKATPKKSSSTPLSKKKGGA